MIEISYDNTIKVNIIPCPLISISQTPIRNKVGTLGSNYSITLNGTIISDRGIPYFSTSHSNIPSNPFTVDPVNVVPTPGKYMSSIFEKQNALRELFAKDGQKIVILNQDGTRSGIVCYPNLVSIDFEEGNYLNISRYTISLEAPLLFDSNNNILEDSLLGLSFSPKKYSIERDYNFYNREFGTKTLANVIEEWGGIVEDFTDTWSIETDESVAETSNIQSSKIIPRSYRMTRNMSATGRTFYHNGAKYEGWEQALGFIKKTLLTENTSGRINTPEAERYKLYPGYYYENIYSSGFLNLNDPYKGYNHVMTVNFDKTAGSCNVTETWLIASGDLAFENYVMSVGASRDTGLTSVKIDGTIKGLSNIPASGYMKNNQNLLEPQSQYEKTPYKQALEKYILISNSGQFGINSPIYQRANNLVSTSLNSQPLSLSLGINENAGEITYSLEFNDRPLNYFDGVLSENISIADTYPGDVFAVIPIIGRMSGPILQPIRTRTVYSRDVSIELLLDYTELPSDHSRENFLLRKPSLYGLPGDKLPIHAIREQLKNLLRELSPFNDPDVNPTGYFVKPPSESWSPLDGRYSFNVSWEYEKLK